MKNIYRLLLAEARFLLKSLAAALFVVLVAYMVRVFFNTPAHVADVESVNAFISGFGVLYGAMVSFVVFEVWNQYNKTDALISKEALGLRNLYRLTLYFKEGEVTERMKNAIRSYVDLVINDEFKVLPLGSKSEEASSKFHNISKAIRGVKFDDRQDPIVFDHFLTQYEQLSVTRTERINESLSRVPPFLKMFNYLSSFFIICIFLLLPFESVFYELITIGILTFVIVLVLQLIEELDNPFFGYWRLTPEPFMNLRSFMDRNNSLSP